MCAAVEIPLFRMRRVSRTSLSSCGQRSPSTVRRRLFGSGPVDHEEIARSFNDQIKEISKEAESRWNFNFSNETPLNGRFEWSKLKNDTAQEVAKTSKDDSCPEQAQDEKIQKKITDFMPQRKRTADSQRKRASDSSKQTSKKVRTETASTSSLQLA